MCAANHSLYLVLCLGDCFIPGLALKKESLMLGLLFWRVFFYCSAGIGEERVPALQVSLRGNPFLFQLLESSVLLKWYQQCSAMCTALLTFRQLLNLSWKAGFGRKECREKL